MSRKELIESFNSSDAVAFVPVSAGTPSF